MRCARQSNHEGGGRGESVAHLFDQQPERQDITGTRWLAPCRIAEGIFITPLIREAPHAAHRSSNNQRDTILLHQDDDVLHIGYRAQRP